MAIQHFALLNQTAGMGAQNFIRIFDASGNVFDFDDNLFKTTLALATTPYKTAVERVAMGGTLKSSYIATVDLTTLWNKQGGWFWVVWYANTVPADTDEAIAPVGSALIMDPGPAFWVEFGEYGQDEVLVQYEANVKSTSGDTLQISMWLERNGKRVNIDAADASVTGSATFREHGISINHFVKSFVNSDIFNDRFEGEQDISDPNSTALTNDRQYGVDCKIVINGTTYQTSHSTVVIG